MNEKIYTEQEILDLVQKAEDMGMDTGPGSDLERLTIEELERLVTVKMQGIVGFAGINA